MRSRFFVCILALLILSEGNILFAFGKKEAEPEKEPVNAQWNLTFTALDVSALPLSRQVIGSVVLRSLVSALRNQEFRFRGEEESAYYRDYAWAKSRSETAKALQTKRNERDQLIYRGDPRWRYRKNLKTVDEAILKLEEDMEKINASSPVVEEKPVFMVGEGSGDGFFPQPPVPGGEYSFCKSQSADAFIVGDLSEYHGRIYLSIRMYTLYTHSYSYEDFVLFSLEDLNGAMDEISIRLAAAVSEIGSSGIIVYATPPEAIVLIDGAFASQGELHSYSPGNAELDIRADNYIPVTVPLELNADELAELYIDLSPLSLASFEAVVPGSPGASVYLGSLYVGETPLTLELPRTQFAYISVEQKDGDIGSVVYRDNDLVKGSAHFVHTSGYEGTAAFNTKTPVSSEEKRVDRARRGFYGAYGVFWVVLPISLLTAGAVGNYITAHNYVAANSLYGEDYDKRKEIYDNAILGRNISYAAYGVMGAALGVTFFQIFRYLYVSGGDSTPIVKAPKKPPETEE